MISCENTTHNRYRRPIAVVILMEATAGEQRNTHRVEVIRADHSIIGGWGVFRLGGWLVRTNEMDERNAFGRQGQNRHQARCLDTRHRGQTRLELTVKSDNPGAIVIPDLRQREPHRQKIYWIKSRLFITNPNE